MKQGFSLVELSIVLVILGLLTGGILAGQSLIRAAEMRSVSTEAARYQTALHTFRDKYFAIAGDMNNATKFWGDDNAACADAGVPNGTPGTCNGDGDGTVEFAAAGGLTGEFTQAWKQLALAGLVEGSYSGLASAAAGYAITPGTNIPASKLNRASWNLVYFSYTADPYNYTMNFGNHLSIHGGDGNGVLKPEEAWNVDTKMDDGMPGRGSVIAILWDDCTTSSSATDYAGEYALLISTQACGLRFKNSI